MGLAFSENTLSNPAKSGFSPMAVWCLVDISSAYLCIQQHVATPLGLEPSSYREAIMPIDESKAVSYCGPLKIEFEKRSCFVGALILGDEVLPGAVPMEDMDLLVHPKRIKLSVNPDSPNMARGHLK